MPEILKIFHVVPVPKPRMTQQDRWKKRKCVLDYWEYREELQFQAWPDFEMPAEGYHALFVMPMPKSWSAKKKMVMHGLPHRQAPDKDNLEKALLDALCKEGDAHISDGRSTKVWGYEGMVIIMAIKPPTVEEIKRIIAEANSRCQRIK